MYKYKLNKYLKKINQINQFGGEINTDFLNTIITK